MKKLLNRITKMILNKDWRNVKNFESACRFNNQDFKILLDRWKKLDSYQINTLKLEYCIKTINEEWKPNWKDNTEYKWYNWFNYKSAVGWVFVGSDDFPDGSGMGVGLFYQNKEKAEHGANYFLDMYKVYLG